MKTSFFYFTIIILSFGCKNSKSDTEPSKGQVGNDVKAKTQFEIYNYRDTTWNFTFQYSSDFIVAEEHLPGNSSVINVYPKSAEINKPLAIHEEPKLAYISFLPEGFGVDAPSGDKKSIKDWKGNLDLSFNINENESQVYLLENERVWAYFLRFHQAPEEWSQYGGIFVHYSIKNFKASCVSASGGSKPIQQCDPMGADEINISGEIDEESKNRLDMVLSSLYFFSEDADERHELSELIKVETPLPNNHINSPLQISGKARGDWFFEAEAPVELVDKDYKVLAQTTIKAKGDWMTSDFVPFSGELSFEDVPTDERGYLLFDKSNASGKPEFDRKLTLPVCFPPE